MNNTMFHDTLKIKDVLQKACCSCINLYILRITEHRVREIAYGFGGPSEENVSPY